MFIPRSRTSLRLCLSLLLGLQIPCSLQSRDSFKGQKLCVNRLTSFERLDPRFVQFVEIFQEHLAQIHVHPDDLQELYEDPLHGRITQKNSPQGIEHHLLNQILDEVRAKLIQGREDFSLKIREAIKTYITSISSQGAETAALRQAVDARIEENQTPLQPRTFSLGEDINYARVSPDGRTIGTMNFLKDRIRIIELTNFSSIAQIPGGRDNGLGAPLAMVDDAIIYTNLILLNKAVEYNFKTQRQRRVFRSPFGILNGLMTSPDGQFIASGGSGGQVRVWNRNTGRPIEFAIPKTQDSGRPIRALAFDDQAPILGILSGETNVEMWDIYSGNLKRRSLGLFFHPELLAFRPQSSEIAAVGGNGDVALIPIDPHLPQFTFQTREKPVSALKFSLDGLHMALGYSDGEIWIYDITAVSQPRLILSGGKGSVIDLMIHRSKRELIAIYSSGLIRIFPIPHEIAGNPSISSKAWPPYPRRNLVMRSWSRLKMHIEYLRSL